ncbi:MAG: hypothetical protein LBH04_11895 [Tannerellaceae bacterium]|jgi:hypothetical protein|nr:hypothetical protein [Tannerellaceae bacterium]
MYKAAILTLFPFLLFLLPSPLRGQSGDWFNDPGDYAFQGKGSSSSPYLISSVSSLVHLAERVNKWHGENFKGICFKLTANLDLGEHYWIPIGCESEQTFCGTFDGNGKTIRNLYIGEDDADNPFSASALFGNLGNGAQITNLTIEGGHIYGGGRDTISRAASLAAHVYCHVSENTDDSIIIRNCHNHNVDITGGHLATSIAGGLIGETYAFSEGPGQALILIDTCSNTGMVTGAAANHTIAGGIAGKSTAYAISDRQSPASAACHILSCYNQAPVKGATAQRPSAITAAGGILGYSSGSGSSNNIEDDSSGSITIQYCMNTGSITGGAALAPNASTFAGGLTACAYTYAYGNAGGKGFLQINASANRGRIESGLACDPAATSCIGGLAGLCAASVSGPTHDPADTGSHSILDVADCYNYSILASKGGAAGGLIGCIETTGNTMNRHATALLINSYAAGAITNHPDAPVPSPAGGLVGQVRQANPISNPPTIINNLAYLHALRGDAEHTNRIVGEIKDAPTSAIQQIHTQNYAHIRQSHASPPDSPANGQDWAQSLHRPPISTWDFKNHTWLLVDDPTAMPLLNHLPGQTLIKIGSTY